MNSKELRQKYLDFFKSKNHAIVPSASVVPENNPTLLFINCGVAPLEPYIVGEKHPLGKRITDVQKSIRTIDLDEVGDTTHHSFFEMLGNWSFGDYFKQEIIPWTWELFTSKEWLGLDPNRLAVSVFKGDDNAPFDQESFDAWRKAGVPEARIAKLGKDNWWGPAGETGPCGPSTEIFYWVGDPNEVPDSFNDDHDSWVEMGNDVLMEYNKKADGSFEKLSQHNVDTGMSLERILTALNGLDDNYRTDVFMPIVEKIEEISGKKYDESEEVKRSMRVIADHIKAAVIMIADGVEPSNTERGYILRRLIRRAIRQGKCLGIEENFTVEIARVVQDIYKDAYPETSKDCVTEKLQAEEEKFRKTLEKGLKELEKIKDKGEISGVEAFNLYQTYGFPLELIQEEGLKVDEEGFQKSLKEHQEKSRTASAGMFKGGLADTEQETRQLHTVAHLMLAGLRKVLGDHVHQKGSNINGERVRFDFSHPEKMTDEEKKAVEDYVNEAIDKKVPVECCEMSLSEAKECGAEGAFEDKYGDKVKTYKIDCYSNEICGGPHVENTGDIKGAFKIKKEQSSSAGVRRIKAILE